MKTMGKSTINGLSANQYFEDQNKRKIFGISTMEQEAKKLIDKLEANFYWVEIIESAERFGKVDIEFTAHDEFDPEQKQVATKTFRDVKSSKIFVRGSQVMELLLVLSNRIRAKEPTEVKNEKPVKSAPQSIPQSAPQSIPQSQPVKQPAIQPQKQFLTDEEKAEYEKKAQVFLQYYPELQQEAEIIAQQQKLEEQLINAKNAYQKKIAEEYLQQCNEKLSDALNNQESVEQQCKNLEIEIEILTKSLETKVIDLSTAQNKLKNEARVVSQLTIERDASHETYNRIVASQNAQQNEQ